MIVANLAVRKDEYDLTVFYLDKLYKKLRYSRIDKVALNKWQAVQETIIAYRYDIDRFETEIATNVYDSLTAIEYCRNEADRMRGALSVLEAEAEHLNGLLGINVMSSHAK